MERSTSGVIGAAFVTVISLLSISLVIGLNARSVSQRRHELKAAVTLVARANCREISIMREATLARSENAALHAVILRFYRQLEAPINDALEKLGQTPC